MNAFCVSKIDTIHFFDIESYKRMAGSEIKINLFNAEGDRERNEIIAMHCSQNQDYLAVISGKNLIMN